MTTTNTADQIGDVERRVRALNLPMAFLLGRANVPPSTWVRWKRGQHGPTKRKWDAVIATLEDLERRLSDR